MKKQEITEQLTRMGFTINDANIQKVYHLNLVRKLLTEDPFTNEEVKDLLIFSEEITNLVNQMEPAFIVKERLRNGQRQTQPTT